VPPQLLRQCHARVGGGLGPVKRRLSVVLGEDSQDLNEGDQREECGDELRRLNWRPRPHAQRKTSRWLRPIHVGRRRDSTSESVRKNTRRRTLRWMSETAM